MDDPMMNSYEESYRPCPLTVEDWLQERLDNCLRISKEKRGIDKIRWLEDARYFKMAIDKLRRTE